MFATERGADHQLTCLPQIDAHAAAHEPRDRVRARTNVFGRVGGRSDGDSVGVGCDLVKFNIPSIATQRVWTEREARSR
jgi:hypothetical protein